MDVSGQPYLQPIYHGRNIHKYALKRSRHGHFGEQENLLPLSEIRFPSLEVRSLLTTLTATIPVTIMEGLPEIYLMS
jgi:hypothetical protein